MKQLRNNRNAVIVLHEIYGVNSFMEEVCTEYLTMGFDVFCPDMLGQTCFSYSEASEAYQYFINEVGFDSYREIVQLIETRKFTYDKVFVIGFSVGATIAWRCCEGLKCDGIICCYGSRIRDYLQLEPCCPVQLLFAEQDSFDVDSVMMKLRKKSNVELHKLKASHGFMDQYSTHFNLEQTQISKALIRAFLLKHTS
ncbi:MAG: alpha/beta fold hydrolase [Lawsonibacter sp.]|nr:alpha/beta fold hydrolase [Lawsonibacter sp.]